MVKEIKMFTLYYHVFITCVQVISMIGGFAYIMDKDGSFRNSFSDGWDRILSKHPIPFYYCIGKMSSLMILLLVLTGD